MKPDVSIIVATHDRPAMLETELHSILAAAATVRERVQVLVVDDASPTMAAWSVAKRLGVDYLRRESNGGVAATLADGFAASKGRYTSFWGDDDFMLPIWFERHLAAIRDADVVSGSYWFADADLNPTSRWTLPVGCLSDLLDDRVTVNDGALCRRSVIEAAGLRPERERAMMLTLWLALAKAGVRFATVTEPTWLYRRHANNMSGQLPLRHDDHFIALRREAIAEAMA